MTSRILSEVRCFLLDMDGTIYLDNQLLPGAEDFINYLESQKIEYYFITNNSSRSRSEYEKKLESLGLSIGESKIFTSGEATAIYLKKNYPDAALYVVGTPSLEDELKDHGFNLVQDGADCVVLGFDTTLTYKKIWKLCDYVSKGYSYIATHPDINCPTATGFMPDIGSMIAMVATSTGRQPDVIVGKPNTPMVDAIVEKTGYSANQMAMIGDRLYTDIALGEAGIATILVLTGETKTEDISGSPFQPDYIFESLQGFLEEFRR